LAEIDLAFKNVSLQIIEDIKHKHGCAYSFKPPCSKYRYSHSVLRPGYDRMRNKIEKEERYELPDGSVVELGSASNVCVEPMFCPVVRPYKFKDAEVRTGIADTIIKCIRKCPHDVRTDMLANIVLSGGGTMIKNFDTRLANDLNGRINPQISAPKRLASKKDSYLAKLPEQMTEKISSYIPANKKIRLIAGEERNLDSWIGGSIVSSIGVCFGPPKHVSAEEYDEVGPRAIWNRFKS